MKHLPLCLPADEGGEGADVVAHVEVAVVLRAVVRVKELRRGTVVEAVRLEVVVACEWGAGVNLRRLEREDVGK